MAASTLSEIAVVAGGDTAVGSISAACGWGNGTVDAGDGVDMGCVGGGQGTSDTSPRSEGERPKEQEGACVLHGGQTVLVV